MQKGEEMPEDNSCYPMSPEERKMQEMERLLKNTKEGKIEVPQMVPQEQLDRVRKEFEEIRIKQIESAFKVPPLEEEKNGAGDLTPEHIENQKKLIEAVTLGSIPLKLAYRKLSLEMKADPEYAYSWHCNVACAAMDEGVDHETANKIATRFMSIAFQVKTEYKKGKEE